MGGDPGMNGTERPSVEKGLAMIHTTNSIIPFFSCTFTFFIPFSLDHNPLFLVLFFDHNHLNLTNNIYKSLPMFLLIIIFFPNYHYSNYHIKYLIPYVNIPHSHPNL